MKFLLPFLTAILLFKGTVVSSQNASTSQPETSTVTIADSTTTSEVVTTTVSEPSVTTITTTSSEATTTTLLPTTTTTTTTSTTTTTRAPLTTKAPEPTPPVPEECTWNVTQQGLTCIRAELKVRFDILVGEKHEYITLSCGASTAGSECSNDTQTLVLSERNNYTLTFVFVNQANTVFVNNTIFSYTIPEGTGTVNDSGKMFSVKTGNSYKCKSETDIKFENVTMEISYMHIQAFAERGNTEFGPVEECEADDKVSDIVPIAVGCTLAALIVIVLIAYLVGRRQSRQKGYQSV